MKNRPLSITSPNHAVALSVYGIIGLSGLLFVVKVTTDSVMHRAAGGAITDVWGTVLMIAGFAAFFSAQFAKRSSKPEHNLRVEMFADIALFVSLGYASVMIFKELGPAAITTGLWTIAFSLGTLLRAAQIFFEVRLLKKARAHPKTSAPVLADPREEAV